MPLRPITPDEHQDELQTGYLHHGYAQALSQFGAPIELPRSKAWFLKRPIPGSAHFDGIGCYPYMLCRDWAGLASDFEINRDDLVSFSAVPDPFGSYTIDDLKSAFPDRFVHFKDHHVADLGVPVDELISRHHRREAMRALKRVEVEFCEQPIRFLDAWVELFNVSADRFSIKGIRAYSVESFAKQLALPGACMSIARHQGKVIAAHIQMLHGDVVYAHLSAANDLSNKMGASYALYYSEIQYFSDKARWIDWGGEAGLVQNGNLSSFKRGWSTGVRPVYFCGRIFDRKRYDEITSLRCKNPGDYFPAYREGEFD
jgi:hypothetical protein